MIFSIRNLGFELGSLLLEGWAAFAARVVCAALLLAAAAAGSLVGTYWFLMMCGRLLGGLLGGKISSKVQLSFVASLALIFVLVGIFAPTDVMGAMPVFTGTGFGMVEVPVGVIFFTLCGLCTSVMWGGIFNLAVEGLGKYTSAASGIFMVMVCGGGILPLIQGLVADHAGYMMSFWVVFAGVLYICLLYTSPSPRDS